MRGKRQRWFSSKSLVQQKTKKKNEITIKRKRNWGPRLLELLNFNNKAAWRD